METTLISPSPYQPRRSFNQQLLAQLADSIRAAGVMQPILVRLKPGAEGYELIAGERRWRASMLAGLTAVPAIISEASDEQAAEWALIENLQRQDLGAMERAWALRSLGEKFGLTHQQISERVGLDRSTITNLIRMTELEPDVCDLLDRNVLSMGHGRALLAAPAGAARIELAMRAGAQGWSVRRIEKEAVALSGAKRRRKADPSAEAGLRQLEIEIGAHLGTKVTIRANTKGTKGEITFEFYDPDHFEGLLTKLGFVEN